MTQEFLTMLKKFLDSAKKLSSEIPKKGSLKEYEKAIAQLLKDLKGIQRAHEELKALFDAKMLDLLMGVLPLLLPLSGSGQASSLITSLTLAMTSSGVGESSTGFFGKEIDSFSETLLTAASGGSENNQLKQLTFFAFVLQAALLVNAAIERGAKQEDLNPKEIEKGMAFPWGSAVLFTSESMPQLFQMMAKLYGTDKAQTELITTTLTLSTVFLTFFAHRKSVLSETMIAKIQGLLAKVKKASDDQELQNVSSQALVMMRQLQIALDKEETELFINTLEALANEVGVPVDALLSEFETVMEFILTPTKKGVQQTEGLGQTTALIQAA